jgi:hypothetical protein
VSTIAFIGWGAVALVVVGWLVVSFSAPSRRRSVIEWLSACGLYVALCALFWSLILRAWEGDNHFALVAFGFLGLMFAVGLGVALFNTVRALRGGGEKGEASATH